MSLHWLLLPLALLIGSLTFRLRGGGSEGKSWQLSGQTARSVWALGCAVIVLLSGGLPVWWIALVALPLTFAAATLPLFHTIDMGHNDGSFAQDFALGSLHGLMLGALPCLPLAWAAYGCPGLSCPSGHFTLWWAVLIGGTAWGACYALAWRRLDWPEIRAIGLGRNGNPPEAAELGFGAVFALGLFLAATP